MNAEAMGEELNELLGSATRGMLQYVGDSTPYLTPHTFAIWTGIQAVGAAVAQQGRILTDLLERLDLPVRPASFDMNVARYPFTSIESLLPLLVDEAQRRVDINERAAALAADHDPLRRQLASMLDQNRAHLESLRSARDELAPDPVNALE